MIATSAKSGSSRRVGEVGEDGPARAIPGVDAAERDRRIWPDAAPAPHQALARHRVHVLGAGHAVLDEPNALAHQSELQPVPHESRHVASPRTGTLPRAATVSCAKATVVRRGPLTGDHLDGRHQQRRVEVMRADRAFRPADPPADRARSGGTRCSSRRLHPVRAAQATPSADVFSSRSSGSDSTRQRPRRSQASPGSANDETTRPAAPLHRCRRAEALRFEQREPVVDALAVHDSDRGRTSARRGLRARTRIPIWAPISPAPMIATRTSRSIVVQLGRARRHRRWSRLRIGGCDGSDSSPDRGPRGRARRQAASSAWTRWPPTSPRLVGASFSVPADLAQPEAPRSAWSACWPSVGASM